MKSLTRYSLFSILVLLLIPTISFAQIIVTSTADSGPGTLREAIETTATGGETITFNLPGAAPHTITLSTQILIDVAMTINGPGKENLTISGNNNSRIFNIDSGGANPTVGEILVTIRDITLSNGDVRSDPTNQRGGAIFNVEDLTLEDCEISNNISGGDPLGGGGGMFTTRGQVLINRCDFLGNMDINTGGDSFGGAIDQSSDPRFTFSGDIFATELVINGNSSQGTTSGNGGGLSIRNQSSLSAGIMEVSENTATGDIVNGGGIYILSSFLELTSVNIVDNLADATMVAKGGGINWTVIDNINATYDVTSVAIGRNRARGPDAFGGGVYSEVAIVTTTTSFFLSSTISENVAESTGQPLVNFAYGGGLYIFSDGPFNDNRVDMISSTIAFNSCEGSGSLDGAGIYADVVTPSQNPSIFIRYKNLLVAGQSFNPDPNDPSLGLNCRIGYTPLISTDTVFNPPQNVLNIFDAGLAGDADGCTGYFDPAFDAATMLGPLQNNGGYIETNALIDTVAPPNPAIDGVPQSLCDDSLFFITRNFNDSSGSLDLYSKDDRNALYKTPLLNNWNFKHLISNFASVQTSLGAVPQVAENPEWLDLTPSEMYGSIKHIALGANLPNNKLEFDYNDYFESENSEDQRGFFGSDLTEDARPFPRPYDWTGTGGTPFCDFGSFELQPVGTVAIAKVSEPAGGTGFEFTGTGFTLGCDLDGMFTLDDGESTAGCILPLGNFTVTETNNQGLTFLDINCLGTATTTPDIGNSLVDIEIVNDGDDGICTFFNSDTPGMVSLTVVLQGTGTGSAVTGTPGEIDCTSTGNMDCGEAYPIGETVTLTATPDIGSTFDGWSGDCPATTMNDTTITLNVSSTCIATFSIAPPVTLTVELQGSGTGEVLSTNPGIDCTSAGNMDCDETYLLGEPVTLTATPDPGSLFTGWSGDAACSGDPTNPILNLTMDMDINCIATFDLIPPVTLDVTLQGTGTGAVASTNPGIDCTSAGNMDCDEVYLTGDMVTLTATPDVGSSFTGWSGDAACSGDPTNPILNLTMNMDISCIATFDLIPVTLNVTIEGNGEGGVLSTNPAIDCNSSGTMDCDEVYNFGDTVTLTATALPLSTFTGWSGDVVCTGDPLNPILNLTMDMDISCIATFVLDQATLDVVIQGSGSCAVTSVPTGINCVNNQGDCSETYNPPGVTVDLTVIPEVPSSIFTGWSGDCSGLDADTSITVNVDSTCIATCVLSEFVLNPIFPALDDNINSISAEHAFPGGNVAFVWGKLTGSLIVGGSVCNGTELGIMNPQILAIKRANDFGIATHIFYIPLFGDFEFQIQLQAVDIRTCRTSNIVPQIIRKEESG